MNGKERIQLVRAEERVMQMHGDIKEMKEEFKLFTTNCERRYDCINKRFGLVDSKIYFAMGGVSALSLLALTKSIGLW